MFYCCEAIHDEAGRLGWEGLSIPGDQYGTEVIRRPISADGERWLIVYRPKNPAKAYIIGECALQMALNDMIGYDQRDRLSFYNLWRALPDNARNIMNIMTPCNCDCSAGIAVCVISAGINITPEMRTAIEDKVLMDTGEFIKIPYEQGMKLYKGDILWREGHTGAIGEVTEEQAPLFIGEIKKLSGVYKTPLMRSKNKIPEHPLVGAGNRVKVLEEVQGIRHIFYKCDVGDGVGFILKTRVKVAK